VTALQELLDATERRHKLTPLGSRVFRRAALYAAVPLTRARADWLAAGAEVALGHGKSLNAPGRVSGRKDLLGALKAAFEEVTAEIKRDRAPEAKAPHPVDAYLAWVKANGFEVNDDEVARLRAYLDEEVPENEVRRPR
jgi:hypothetical protein